MSQQVTHEAEHHRQHVRFRIPATIQIDEHTFLTADWSVSGLSIDDFPPDLGQKTHNTGYLIFDFGGYDFRIKINIEKVRFELSSGHFAGRFSELSSQSISLIHYMINAYLAGEVVTAGDILTIAKEGQAVSKDLDKRLEVQRSGFETFMFNVKRVVGHALYATIIVGLLWFVSFTLYNRMYVVESSMVSFDKEQIALRSPSDGLFEYQLSGEQKRVKKGELIATLKRVNGGVLAIESPCDCTIDKVHGLAGVFIAQGELLVTLLRPGTELKVHALIPIEKGKKITVGDNAAIRLSDGRSVNATVANVTMHDEIADSAIVVFNLIDPIDNASIDTLASVRIETF